MVALFSELGHEHPLVMQYRRRLAAGALLAVKAIVFDRLGGPEVMELREVPDPVPGDGEVLVRRRGGRRQLPRRLRAARAATTAPTRRRSSASRRGGIVGRNGERLAVGARAREQLRRARRRDRARRRCRVPDGVATDVAVAALLQGMTAHYLAHDSYPIEAGDWVLVHAAAGGVGLLLTQIAKLRGGRVIATTSTDEKAALARDGGADEVIGYDELRRTRARADRRRGVAAVYDGIGKTTFAAGFTALRRPGG